MTSAYEHVSHDIFRFGDIGDEPHGMISNLKGYESMPLVSLEKAIEPLVPCVPDIQQMVATVLRSPIEPKDGLTYDESASIMLYSMQWIPRENSFYSMLNKTLRSTNRDKLLPPWLLYLRLFITALAKLPSTPDQQVYRGINIDLREHYRVSTSFIWAGFSSCTPHIHILENASFFGQTDIRTLFTIHSETGKNIKPHSFFHVEDEIVFMPGVEFEVVSSRDMGNSLYMIHLKEIQNRFPHAPPILQHSSSNTMRKVNFMVENANSTPQPTGTKQATNQKSEHSHTIKQKDSKITDAGVQRIIDEFIVRKKSTELDLSWNKITHEGAALIAKALHKNQVNRFLPLLINENLFFLIDIKISRSCWQ